MFKEGCRCGSLGEVLPAEEDTKMSFVNLEKRPERPQVKNYITIDIYR